MTAEATPTWLPSGVELRRHPRARQYILRVQPDGAVRVTIPRWGSKRDAMAFAAGQHTWIAKQLARIEEERRRPKECVPIPQELELRARAKRELPVRLFQLAASFGLCVRRVSVRNQRWRWASCSRSGHVCLNWRLIAMPEWVCHYVLVHELMHLRRMDHSPRFWKLVAGACPDYQEARTWLRVHARQD